MQVHTEIERRVQAHDAHLIALSRRIHANPEVAWEEEKAARWTGEALTDLGFTVEQDFCGLPTAIRGRIGHGPLHIAICAEYDALPGLGHACGHNVIAGAAVGAAAGLAALADDLGLTVEVLGTPAEEGGGGKILMLERGGFDGVHAAMMIHTGPGDVAHARSMAASHVEVSYEGKAAHAAAYPEQGRNAADAMTVAQVSIGLLRQQAPSSTRVHGIVTHGGEASNAIPQNTTGRWFIRADSSDELAEFEPRVLDCFRAGALATGTVLETRPLMRPYAHFENDEDLVAYFVRNAARSGRRFDNEQDAPSRMSRSSTDMGNVSLALPSIHPFLGIDSYPVVNHQREFAALCVTPAADRALMNGAVAMAQTVADVAQDRVAARTLDGHPNRGIRDRSPVMTTARDLARALFAAYNDHDASAAGALYAADAEHVEMSNGGGKRGPAAIAEGLAYLLRGFPDARWRVRDVIATDDRAAVTYRLTGSLQSPFGPFAECGQKLDLSGVLCLRRSGSHIARAEDYWDSATFRLQMDPRAR